jgi:hypothetical protein
MIRKPRPPAPPAPVITSVSEAERAIANLNRIMDRLESHVAEESARVRQGRLGSATEAERAKAELAHNYAMEAERVKSAKAVIASSLPDALEALRNRHERFQTLLQDNLMVLATAHAVSEGIIRGVAGEFARKQAPSTYGASGRASPPASKTSAPMAVSRTL